MAKFSMTPAGTVLGWPVWGQPPDRGRISSNSDDHLARGGGEAIDLAYDAGTPLVLIHPAHIQAVGYAGDCGWTLRYTWTDGGAKWEVGYCHLLAGSYRVTEGQQVDTGTIVAQVGSTGESTGPHLHIAIWLNGSRVRPEDLLLEQAFKPRPDP